MYGFRRMFDIFPCSSTAPFNHPQQDKEKRIESWMRHNHPDISATRIEKRKKYHLSPFDCAAVNEDSAPNIPAHTLCNTYKMT